MYQPNEIRGWELCDLVRHKNFDRAESFLSNVKNSTRYQEEDLQRLLNFKRDNESALLVAIRLDKNQIDLFKCIIDVGGVDQVLGVKGRYGSNAWIYACQYNCPLHFLQYLKDLVVEEGRRDELLKSNDIGDNVFHQVCQYSESLELVRFAADLFHEIAQDSDSGADLLDTDNYGNNALFKCLKNSSLAIPHYVIDVLADNDKLRDAVLKRNNNEMNILSFVCQRGPTQQFAKYFNLIFELVEAAKEDTDVNWEIDRDGYNFIDHLLQRSEEIPVDLLEKILSRQFKMSDKTLELLQSAPRWTKTTFLADNYVRKTINEKFAEGNAVYILMSNLHVQIFLWYTFSFAETSDHPATYAFFIGVGTLFLLVMEAVQFYNTKIHYFLDISNYTDWFQIVLVTIAWFDLCIDGTIGGNDDRLYGDRLALTALIVGWELLGVCSNFNKKLAVSFYGFIEILKELIPFLLTTILLVLAFASAFRILGAPDNKVCENEATYSSREEFIEDGGWTCTSKDSILFTLTMFLSAEWAFLGSLKGFRFFIAILNAIAMGFILLNIVIAVVNMAFGEVNARALAIFWEGRLAFLNTASRFFDVKQYWQNNRRSYNQTSFEKFWYSMTNSDLTRPFMYPFTVCSEAKSVLRTSLRNDYSKDLFLQYHVFRGRNVPENLPKYQVNMWIQGYYFCAVVHMLIIMPLTFVIGVLSFGHLWGEEWKDFIFEAETESEISNHDQIINGLKKMDMIATKLEKVEKLLREQKSFRNNHRSMRSLISSVSRRDGQEKENSPAKSNDSTQGKRSIAVHDIIIEKQHSLTKEQGDNSQQDIFATPQQENLNLRQIASSEADDSMKQLTTASDLDDNSIQKKIFTASHQDGDSIQEEQVTLPDDDGEQRNDEQSATPEQDHRSTSQEEEQNTTDRQSDTSQA